MLFARGVGQALRLAPVRARFGFGRRCGGDARPPPPRPSCRLASTSLRAAASSPSIACRRPRSASRRAAPVGACAATAKPSQRQKSPSRDTSRWPGLSMAASRAPVGALDDADLGEPARQVPAALAHMRTARRRLPAARDRTDRAPRRPSASARTSRPAHRDRRPARRRAPFRSPCVTVIASITGGHRFLLSTASSLPMVLASVSSRCTPLLGGGERRARGVDLFARACVCAASAACAAVSASASAACALCERRRQRRQIGRAAVGRGQAGIDIGELGFEPCRALLVLAQAACKLIAARRQIGERAGQFGEGFLRRRQAPRPPPQRAG